MLWRRIVTAGYSPLPSIRLFALFVNNPCNESQFSNLSYKQDTNLCDFLFNVTKIYACLNQI